MGIGSLLGKAMFFMRKNSSDILKVAGVAGIGVGFVMGCHASRKLDLILQDGEGAVDTIEDRKKADPDYSPEEESRDIMKARVITGLSVARLYLPSIATMGLSVFCIIESNNILKKRNLGLAAAYATVSSSFAQYRTNVKEEYGEDVDRKMRFGISTETVVETIIDEDGNEKVVEQEIMSTNHRFSSDYARVFSREYSSQWSNSPTQNMFLITSQQSQWNDVLNSRGWVLLNDVYKGLGFPETKAGQIVGWLKNNPNGDSFIDFNIPDSMGYTNEAVLDFNVDGPIFNLLPIDEI